MELQAIEPQNLHELQPMIADLPNDISLYRVIGYRVLRTLVFIYLLKPLFQDHFGQSISMTNTWSPCLTARH